MKTFELKIVDKHKTECWAFRADTLMDFDHLKNYIETWLTYKWQVEELQEELKKVMDSDFISKNSFVGTFYYKRGTKEYLDALIWDKNFKIKELEDKIKTLTENKDNLKIILFWVIIGFIISIAFFM